jgi:hypothetical protein
MKRAELIHHMTSGTPYSSLKSSEKRSAVLSSRTEHAWGGVDTALQVEVARFAGSYGTINPPT